MRAVEFRRISTRVNADNYQLARGDALARKTRACSSFSNQYIMRRACAILLLVGARAAGVAPAETLASAVPAEKKNPIDAVEATYGSVWKSKFYGAFVLNHRVVLHTIDATPARWRGDAGSSPLDRARTAASSPGNDLVKNCRVHPTHWLISAQVATLSQGRI